MNHLHNGFISSKDLRTSENTPGSSSKWQERFLADRENYLVAVCSRVAGRIEKKVGSSQGLDLECLADVQRLVAAVDFFDLERVVNMGIARRASSHFGEGLHITRHDIGQALLFSDLEQKLGESFPNVSADQRRLLLLGLIGRLATDPLKTGMRFQISCLEQVSLSDPLTLGKLIDEVNHRLKIIREVQRTLMKEDNSRHGPFHTRMLDTLLNPAAPPFSYVWESSRSSLKDITTLYQRMGSFA